MGILKVGVGAARSVLEDQWREYFYCPSMAENVLVKKGENRKSKRGYNKGSENLISNGSIIAVNEGQCMLIVDQGAIAEVCAEAGEFVYDSSTEPTIFYGGLGDGIAKSFKQFARRVTMGGDTGKDQRVYFFNTKEILGNKYGTANPVPFRVVDANVGLDMDIAIRCHGEYAYRITDPILFYKNICGNVEETYTRDQIDSQLKSELLTALQPAFAKISEMGIRYSSLPGHADDLAVALNEVLSDQWGDRYGIQISAIGVNSVKASEEDERLIKELQRNAALKNPNMAAAYLVSAQADAMKAAASNTGAGPMMAFAGMNMAANAGGMNAGNLFSMGMQNQPQPASQTAPGAAESWVCSCGTVNTGKFCSGCGKPKPQPASGAGTSWVCSCGTVNTGKFCSECGRPRPVSDTWVCSCGTVNKGKFCSECGKPRP